MDQIRRDVNQVEPEVLASLRGVSQTGTARQWHSGWQVTEEARREGCGKKQWRFRAGQCRATVEVMEIRRLKEASSMMTKRCSRLANWRKGCRQAGRVG